MATSTAVPVIIGALIGAGGAVIAQGVAAVFTAKRERGRLDWERIRQEQEWEMRKEERFLSLKQELYSSITLLVNGLLAYIYYAIDFPNGNPDEPSPILPDLKELNSLRSNIDVLAPKEVYLLVDMAVVKLIGAVGASGSPHLSPDRIEKDVNEARKKWWEAYHAMRADLHGREVRFKSASSTSTPLPPDEPPALLKGTPRMTWRIRRGNRRQDEV